MNLRPVAPALLLLATAAPSLAYEDMVTGFVIDPPAPFEIDTATPGPTGVRASIRSTTGEPPVPSAGGALCEVLYETNDANAALTQEQINEATQAMWRREQVTATISGQMDILDVSYFGIGEVRGMELVVTPKSGPGAADVRLVLSMAETPKARFVLSCATTAAAIDSALPLFQSIRDTARMP